MPVGTLDEREPARNRTRERRTFGWRSRFPNNPVSFIREQLFGFTPKDEDMAYESSRIRTVRSDGVNVDVYEVHWSDISM
jgi:hypothetical protein